MTEIIRLQTLLSQELTRRFERSMALVFTDVVDSTPYFAQFGDEAGRRLQQQHFDLLERCLPTHEGRIVDTAGDGAFAVFASAPAALQAMSSLRNLVALHNAAQPFEHQLRLRIGMHWGRVLTDGTQVTGEAVNLSARVVGTAAPGEIRLTDALFLQLAPALRARTRALGATMLKGIAHEVELMQLQWRDPALFPSQVLVRETGECINLPPLDTVRFGRGEGPDATRVNDVPLHLPDAAATLQISRRHFELRSHPEGFIFKLLTSQPTEVDGVRLQRDQECPIRPGSYVRVARVMCLEFISPALHAPLRMDETRVGLGTMA